MKNLLLILLLSSISSLTIAQKIYYDKNWDVTTEEDASYYRLIDSIAPDHFWVEDYYLNDTMQMKGRFTSLNPEKKEGLFIWYYENGNPKNEYDYKNGKRNGRHTEWYFDKTVETEGWYKDWKKVGDWKYYYSNGKLMSRSSFKNGNLDGMKIIYNKDSTVEKTIYNDGLFGGYSEVTDKKGNLIMKMEMDENLENGSLKMHKKEGDKVIKANFIIVENKITGHLKTFYKNGSVFFEGVVQDGYKVGSWKTYNEEGEIINEEIFNKKSKEKFSVPSINSMING